MCATSNTFNNFSAVITSEYIYLNLFLINFTIIKQQKQFRRIARIMTLTIIHHEGLTQFPNTPFHKDSYVSGHPIACRVVIYDRCV